MKPCLSALLGAALAVLLMPWLTRADPPPAKKAALGDELKVGKRYHFIPAGRDYFEEGTLVEVVAIDKDWVKVKSFLPRQRDVWINLNQLGAIKTTELEADARAASDVKTIAADGEITYHPGRVVRLSAGVSGTVWRMEKALGQPVSKDDVLALVNAPEVGRAKAEFLQDHAQVELGARVLERLRGVGDVVPAQRLLDEEAAQRQAQLHLVKARQALVNLSVPLQIEDFKGLAAEEVAKRLNVLGLPESLVKQLDSKAPLGNLVALRAPLSGLVTACGVVRGEAVEPTKTICVVADTSLMSLGLHVPVADARHLATGQTVRFRPDGGTADVEGKITWISTALDEKSHTVTAWAELANSDGRLRANMLGRGQIIVSRGKN